MDNCTGRLAVSFAAWSLILGCAPEPRGSRVLPFGSRSADDSSFELRVDEAGGGRLCDGATCIPLGLEPEDVATYPASDEFFEALLAAGLEEIDALHASAQSDAVRCAATTLVVGAAVAAVVYGYARRSSSLTNLRATQRAISDVRGTLEASSAKAEVLNDEVFLRWYGPLSQRLGRDAAIRVSEALHAASRQAPLRRNGRIVSVDPAEVLEQLAHSPAVEVIGTDRTGGRLNALRVRFRSDESARVVWVTLDDAAVEAWYTQASRMLADAHDVLRRTESIAASASVSELVSTLRMVISTLAGLSAALVTGYLDVSGCRHAAGAP